VPPSGCHSVPCAAVLPYPIDASVSLLLGVGGGFCVLALIVVITLGRTMANCWALLTALG
jgi:hypothetical protein